MRKACVISLVVLLAMTSQAVVFGWPPSYAEVVPQHPTSFDIVAITLGGQWGDSCIPNASNISVVGNNIYFDVILDYPPGVYCYAVITPWELTEYVGPLPRGTYSVYANLDGGPYTWMTDFIVSGNPDIDEDGDVNLVDFAILAQAWRAQPGEDNWNPDCNIAEPNDDIINERDLAVLADNWLRQVPVGITYQIDDCDLGAGQSLAGGAESGEVRFSVTVQGRYIHFEDMMVANCCPDEVWLEMEVDNNQITIYEREAGGICLCICDYPVTATLGPFEPGIYILEVYEDWGGFIGSTMVIIE